MNAEEAMEYIRQLIAPGRPPGDFEGVVRAAEFLANDPAGALGIAAVNHFGRSMTQAEYETAYGIPEGE